jgi:NADPH-dependent ferric siderophore reductase
MNQPAPSKPRRVRQKPRLAEVVRVQRLTPHMTRVFLTGPDLEGFETRGPAEHLKVNFPHPGESKVVLPEWGPEGPILRDGQQRPLNRTYTPRRWDAEAGELSIDFLLHGEGPGSAWAQQAQPRQVVAVSHQPGGAYKIDAEADWYFIGATRRHSPRLARSWKRYRPLALLKSLSRWPMKTKNSSSTRRRVFR